VLRAPAYASFGYESALIEKQCGCCELCSTPGTADTTYLKVNNVISFRQDVCSQRLIWCIIIAFSHLLITDRLNHLDQGFAFFSHSGALLLAAYLAKEAIDQFI
jgi:hypothetical protein